MAAVSVPAEKDLSVTTHSMWMHFPTRLMTSHLQTNTKQPTFQLYHSLPTTTLAQTRFNYKIQAKFVRNYLKKWEKKLLKIEK